MREFVIYTVMRILLFVAVLLTVMLVWSLVAEDGRINALWVAVISLLISGVLSYFLLARQREAFAQRVQDRATRATEAFEERRAREDEE